MLMLDSMQCADAAVLDSPMANHCNGPIMIGEELASSELDEVVQKCEKISATLKSKLGAVMGYCR